MAEPGAYDAGAVEARLGADLDRSEFLEFDREMERARRHKAVKAQLGADYDSREVDAYLRDLDRIEARTRRREAFKAALGGDYDGRAFNAAQRAMRDYERQSARVSASNTRLRSSTKDLDVGLLNLSSRLPLVKWGAFAAGAAAAAPPVIALSGALGQTIGLLGAIPGLIATAGGALTTGMLGLRGVGDAVGAAWEGQLTAADDATAASQKAASGVEAIRGAEERLGDALRGAEDAQDELNDARQEAVRHLQDMRMEAEKAAEAEKGTALALREARQELAAMEAEGARGLELAQARQRVRDLELDLADARTESARSSEDLRAAEEGGVRGMPEMVAAREQLADANREVGRAANDLAAAERDARQGMAEATGGAAKLEEKLADLSPAGREFVELISTRFFPLFRQLRDTAQEGLLPGLGRGLMEAERNFPVLERMVGNYADALGDAAEQQGRFLGSQAVGRDLDDIFRQGEQLIRDSADAALDWERGLLHVGVAADPLLDWAGDMNRELADMFEEWARGGRESGRLERFFERSTRKVEQTVEALWDFGRGLINIGSIGARVWGNDMLRDINSVAERFRRWTESVRGQRDIEGYFKRWRDRWREVGEEIDKIVDRYKELREEGKSATAALAQALTEAFGRALPGIAEGAAKAAPVVALAFIEGFLDANAWGKLAIGGWLLAKFGGIGAIRGLGSRIAGALSGGMGAAGASSGGGRLAGLLGGRGSTPANPLFVQAVGGGLGDGKGGAGGVFAGGGRGWLKVALKGAGILGVVVTAAEIAHALGFRAPDRNLPTGSGSGRGTAAAPIERAAEGRPTPGPLTMERQLGERMRPGVRPDESIAAGAVRAGRLADEARRNINRFRVDSTRDLEQLERQASRNLRFIERELGDRTGRGSKLARENISGAIRAITRGMRTGRVDTREAMDAIERLMRTHSREGKEGLRRNLDDVVDTIRRTMRRGRNVTNEGLAIIKDLFVKEARLYGLSEKEALAGANVRTGEVPGGFRRQDEVGREGQFASGGIAGFVGRMGERGRDLVHAIVGRGEAILNYVQQRWVNRGLAAIGLRGGLPELFSRTRGTKHHMAEGGIAGQPQAFQAGGYPMVSGDTDFVAPLGRALSAMARATGTSIFVQSGRRSLSEQAALYQRYLSGEGNLAAAPTPNAPHVRGIAADITPGREVFGSVADRFGLGFTVPSESWHIELLNAALARAAGAATKLKRVVVRGAPSPLRSVIQAVVDRVRRGANRRLGQLGSATGSGDAGPGATVVATEDLQSINKVYPAHGLSDKEGHTRFSPALVQKIAAWAGFGHHSDEMERIAHGESDYYPGIVSTDGGYGLWQNTPRVWGAEGLAFLAKLGGTGQLLNPLKNARMAKYLYDESGGDFDPWYGTQYLAGGGIAGDGASIADFFPFAGQFDGGGFVDRQGMLTGKGAGFRDRTFRVIGRLNEDIEDLGDDYTLASRRFDLTEEEFINEGTETTPPTLNQEAIARRLSELDQLIAIRRKIAMKYRRLARYIDKLLRVYRTMQRRLETTIVVVKSQLEALKGRKGKQARRIRDTLSGRLDVYQGTLGSVNKNIDELGPQLDEAQFEHESSKIDLEELRMERQPLLGSGAGIALPEWEPEEVDTSPDLEAQLEQERAKVSALEEFRRSSQSAFSVFQGPGDIGAGAATAYEAARNPYGPGPAGPGLGLELRDDGRVYPIGGSSPITDPFAAGGAGGGGGATHVHFHSVVPTTAEQAARAAGTVVSGIDGQGARIAPREEVNV